MGFLAFYHGDFDRFEADRGVQRLAAALVGLAFYAGVVLLLWLWLNRRFAGLVGRIASRGDGIALMGTASRNGPPTAPAGVVPRPAGTDS
jgi:hypothetical protein